jgi:hypothetical protein
MATIGYVRQNQIGHTHGCQGFQGKLIAAIYTVHYPLAGGDSRLLQSWLHAA